MVDDIQSIPLLLYAILKSSAEAPKVPPPATHLPLPYVTVLTVPEILLPILTVTQVKPSKL